jgi:hypothetical protein
MLKMRAIATFNCIFKNCTVIMMIIGTICTYLVLFIFLGYFIPHLLVAWFYKTKNLKKAYDAKWALVTGASSGTY